MAPLEDSPKHGTKNVQWTHPCAFPVINSEQGYWRESSEAVLAGVAQQCRVEEFTTGVEYQVIRFHMELAKEVWWTSADQHGSL